MRGAKVDVFALAGDGHCVTFRLQETTNTGRTRGALSGPLLVKQSIETESVLDSAEPEGSFVVVGSQGVHISFPDQGTDAAVVTVTPSLQRSVIAG